MIILVFLILGFLIWLIFFGLPNFSKRVQKQVIKKREILEVEKEPLLGYEKCSPQFQAYMRKEIKAGRKKPKTAPQGIFEDATYTEDKIKLTKVKEVEDIQKIRLKMGDLIGDIFNGCCFFCLNSRFNTYMRTFCSSSRRRGNNL